MAKPEVDEVNSVQDNDEVLIYRGGKKHKAKMGKVKKGKSSLRVEKYTVTADSSSEATITFDSPFSEVPTIIPLDSWDSNQVIKCGVVSVSTTQVSLIAKKSKGTLVLASGPFEGGPNKDISIIVIGEDDD